MASQIKKRDFLLFVLIILQLNFACSGSGGEKVSKKKFTTTPPSTLYFKNMRSSNYEQKQQPNTRVDLYEFRKLELPKSDPILYPVIASNWMEDKAYILIQKNEYERGFASPLTVYWQKENENGKMVLGTPDFEEQHRFCMELNRMIKGSYQLEIENQAKERIEIFTDQKQRSQFAVVMRDYLKLTEQM